MSLGWVFLEILVVLAIAIGIVLWTIPRGSSKPDGARDKKAESDEAR
jgi:hypothetical protein